MQPKLLKVDENCFFVVVTQWEGVTFVGTLALKYAVPLEMKTEA